MIDLPIVAMVVAGGVLVVTGVLAWVVRPLSHPAQLFGALCVGDGAVNISFALNITSSGGSPPGVWLAAQALFLALGIIGQLGVALMVPRPVARSDGWSLALAGALALAVGAVIFVTSWGSGLDGTTHFLNVIWNSTTIFALILLPLRFAKAGPEDAAARSTYALLAVGLILFAAGEGGDLATAIRGASPQKLVQELAYTLGLLAAVPLWVRNTIGPNGKAARNVALLIPALLLLGMFVPGERASLYYAPGILAAALLLAAAMFRGQIEGLDVKFRFAIKTSTIAAVFLAVLFIVANIAQNFLGGQYGVVVGGAAAGLLFFAMAPIQRAAERLAEKAVPASVAAGAVQTTQGRPLARRESTYREALRLALRDRQVTPRERVHLFRLADDLGIAAARAAELQNEVEEAVTHGT